MSTSPKQGFAIRLGRKSNKFFSTAGSYDNAKFVPLKEASTFYSYDSAKEVVKKLWLRGILEATVIPMSELYDAPSSSTAEEPKHDGTEWKEDEKRVKQNVSREEEEHAVNGHKFQKGTPVKVKAGSKDSAKFGSDAAVVVVPDAKGPFVGIAKRGHEQNKDAIHLVSVDDIEVGQNPGTEDEEQSVQENGVPTFMASDLKVGDKVKYQGDDYVVTQGLTDARASQVNIRCALDPNEQPIKVDRRAVTKVNESETMPAKPPLDKQDDESLVNKLVPDVTRDPYKSTEIKYKNEFDKDSDFSDRQETIVKDMEEKVKVPAEIKKMMKDQIEEFKKCADFNAAGRDDVRGSHCLTVADALQMILSDLDIGTVAGMRQASIDLDKLMGPIYQHIPEPVILFIRNGGRPASLMDLFQAAKEKRRAD